MANCLPLYFIIVAPQRLLKRSHSLPLYTNLPPPCSTQPDHLLKFFFDNLKNVFVWTEAYRQKICKQETHGPIALVIVCYATSGPRPAIVSPNSRVQILTVFKRRCLFRSSKIWKRDCTRREGIRATMDDWIQPYLPLWTSVGRCCWRDRNKCRSSIFRLSSLQRPHELS